MEVDSQDGLIQAYGLTPEHEEFLVNLARDYEHIEYLSEGLFASPDLLESAHFCDSYRSRLSQHESSLLPGPERC